jgi:anti-sigma regulatory factor (Ser/Thr protein kinase)
MDSRMHALYKIDHQPNGPGQARQIIAEELSSRLPARVVDDIKLMVSELVTNRIVHRAAERDVPLMLELVVNGNVSCRVSDHGPGFAADEREAPALGAWGLVVVEQLADRWGMQHSPQRTEVWFERHGA